MKTLRYIFLLMIGSFVALAQGGAEGRTYNPWNTMPHQYCAQIKVYTQYGFHWEPLAGKEISVYNNVRAGSGYHTHEITDALLRPRGTFVTPIVGTTKFDEVANEACITFAFKNAGFSGIVDTTMTPTDHTLPTVQWFNPLRVVERFPQGVLKPLVRLRPNSYTGPLTTPLDTRHKDTAGVSGYSFYGTDESVHRLKVMLYAFAIAPENHWHFVPRILRGTLPEGGYADNEVAFQQNAPIFPVWTVRIPAETHQYGFEWDIENPSLWLEAAGASNQEQLDIWLLFKAAAIGSGCRFGLLNPSTGFPMTDAKDGSNQWLTRSVVHLDCVKVQ